MYRARTLGESTGPSPPQENGPNNTQGVSVSLPRRLLKIRLTRLYNHRTSICPETPHSDLIQKYYLLLFFVLF